MTLPTWQSKVVSSVLESRAVFNQDLDKCHHSKGRVNMHVADSYASLGLYFNSYRKA